MDKYITPEELRQIASSCEALDEVYKIGNGSQAVNIDEFFSESAKVYDSNGEVLGSIGFAPDGYALYLPEPEEKEAPPNL